MREIVLRMFFEGHATAEEVSHDFAGTRIGGEVPGIRSSADYRVEPMARDFTVEPEHLVALIGATIEGKLDPFDLGTMSFLLECSNHFTWDTDTVAGERVADALFWLGAPEINWPLTPALLARIQEYLLTGRQPDA